MSSKQSNSSILVYGDVLGVATIIVGDLSYLLVRLLGALEFGRYTGIADAVILLAFNLLVYFVSSFVSYVSGAMCNPDFHEIEWFHNLTWTAAVIGSFALLSCEVWSSNKFSTPDLLNIGLA